MGGTSSIRLEARKLKASIRETGLTCQKAAGKPARSMAGKQAIRLRGGKARAFIRIGDCGSAHACEVLTGHGRTGFSALVGNQRRQKGRNLREDY